MVKIYRLSILILIGAWLAFSPLGLIKPEMTAQAAEEINAEFINGMTPAAGSYTNTPNPYLAASFSYYPGASYFNAKVYVDNNEQTGNLTVGASGFSGNLNLVDGSHNVKVYLIDDLGNIYIRVWGFNLDTSGPITRAGNLTSYTTDHNIIVPVLGSDNLSGVNRTELWYRFNDSEWRQGPVVVGLPSTIHFDANLREGQGKFSFSTLAYDQLGNRESKGLTDESSTIFDITPPHQIPRDKIILEQKSPGTEDSVYGLPGSVDNETVRVVIYRDSGLTDKIVETALYSENRFGAYGIGDNTPVVYIVAFDAAGNQSFATKVENNTRIAAVPNNIRAKMIDSTTALVSWSQVDGASSYRIRYRPESATAFSDYIEVQPDLTNITVANLNPNLQYVFTVVSKDLYGNESLAQTTENQRLPQISGTTSPITPVTVTTTPEPVTTQPLPRPVGPIIPETAPTTKTPEPTPAPESPITPPADNQPAEEATKEGEAENGEVKSESTAKEGRNWTPWIVLAILIILAGAATGGYFYWFGGPEEITTTVKPSDEKKDEDKDNEARW